MTIVPKIGCAFACCASLLAFNASAGVSTDKGNVTVAVGADPMPLTTKHDGGTMLGQATYTVAIGGDTALSVSQSANGGSVYSETTTLSGQAAAFT